METVNCYVHWSYLCFILTLQSKYLIAKHDYFIHPIEQHSNGHRAQQEITVFCFLSTHHAYWPSSNQFESTIMLGETILLVPGLANFVPKFTNSNNCEKVTVGYISLHQQYSTRLCFERTICCLKYMLAFSSSFYSSVVFLEQVGKRLKLTLELVKKDMEISKLQVIALVSRS